jgi:hypothetical protein
MIIEEVEGITKKYFISYYYKHEKNNNTDGTKYNAINYYTLKNNYLFATKTEEKDWTETITKQIDRVSLGIVDIYSRENNFEKAKVDGIYSSSKYLTKVFSIKSNASLPLE